MILEIEIKRLLLPKDPDDSKDVFLEVRAGAGGDEAALFAGDLFRMYSRLSERNNWNMDVVSIREGDHGGYKELVTRIEGNDVYKQLKFEAGVHRVQRVPATESQGRVHTSACSVAVLPEMDEIDEINIKIRKQIKKQLTKNLSLSQLNTIARLALAFQKIIKNENPQFFYLIKFLKKKINSKKRA